MPTQASCPQPAVRPAPDPVTALILACALVLAGLRFFHLGQWSLWIDEALTVADYHLLATNQASGNYNPWAYLLTGRLAEVLDGCSDPFSLRLASALAGVLSIPLTAWALRPLGGCRPAALAALIVALSSWHLYWSHTARFYTLALCLSLLGAGVFLRGLRRSSPGLALVGLALAAGAAAAQLQGVLFLGGLALAPLVLARARLPFPGCDRRTLVAVVSAAALATLVGGGWAWGSFSAYLGSKPSASTGHLLLTTGYHMTPALLAAAALGVYLAWRRRAPGPLLAATLVVSVGGAAFLLSPFALLSAQYLFLLLPYLAYLAVWPLCVCGASAERAVENDCGAAGPPGTGRPRASWAGGLILCGLLVSGGLSCWHYFTVRGGDRPPWRAAWNLVAELADPGDLVCGMAAPIGEYYMNPSHGNLRRPIRVAWIDEHRPRVPEPWSRRGRPTWVVLNKERLVKWDGADRQRFEAQLSGRGELVKRFERSLPGRDLSVELWRLP
jgi:hypothetical protein